MAGTKQQKMQPPLRAGAIIPAAGFGSRMGSDTPKQYLELAGAPILIRTLRVFLSSHHIARIALPVSPERMTSAGELLSHFFSPQERKKIILTAGGATRQDSVRAGLEVLDEELSLILVHDGARPLLCPALIERCLQAAVQHGAAIAAVAVNDTLKQADAGGRILRTVERSGLYRAQTPQAVQRTLFEQACRQADQDGFSGTDEASLLEHAGIPVYLVQGEETNIKITRPGDLQIARSLLGEESMIRIGHGFDAHQLTKGRPLILGGVTIPHPKGLLGHSDADVLTHALIDGLLGALGLGDIGRHFPDSDAAYKDADSLNLLKQVMDKVWDQGYRIGNADLTLLCQRPRLSPYLDTMRKNIARTCRVPVTAINIKATTTEKMGYTGREEGIAAHGVVLLTTEQKGN